MGSQFAIIYDIIVLAVIGGMIFAGVKKGFASVIVGIAAVFVAFFCALLLSGPLSGLIYDNFIEKPISEAVDNALDETMGSVTLSGIEDVDFDKVLISGVPAGEYVPKYEGTGKAVVDLSDLDLSRTGIENVDLSVFGVDPDADLTSLNAKTVEFTMSDIEKYGIGKLAAAQYIAVNAVNSDFFSSFEDYAKTISEAAPGVIDALAGDIENGGTSAVRTVVLNMADASASAKDAVIGGMIEPMFTMIVKTIIFIAIFILVQIILDVIARVLKLVNKVPVIGSVNSLLGGAAGLVQGLITVFVICIVFRFIISVTGGDVMFFNETTVNSTYVFKWLYNFEFLNFLT